MQMDPHTRQAACFTNKKCKQININVSVQSGRLNDENNCNEYYV